MTKIHTMRRVVHVSNKISRAIQLHVSSSVFVAIRTLITSHINVDSRVRVPKGLNNSKKKKSKLHHFIHDIISGRCSIGNLCLTQNDNKILPWKIVTNLTDFKSWSNTVGVVTVAIDNNARQPSSISLKKPENMWGFKKIVRTWNIKWRQKRSFTRI